MSLINDMLSELEQRNQLSTDLPAIPLTRSDLSDKHVHNPFIQKFVPRANARVLIAVALAGITLYSSMLVRNPQSQSQTHLKVDPQNIKPNSLQNVAPSIDRTQQSPTEAHLTKDFAGYNEVTAWEKVQITREYLPETDNSGNIDLTSLPISSAQQSGLFKKVADAVTEGNLSNAQRLLEGLLSRNKDQHKARLLLAKLYIQQQLNGRAESLLATSLIDYPQYAPYAKLYAQILAKEGRDSEAIHAVTTALPTVSTDADYHALLAGLYQRSGDPIAAADSYRDALRLAPEHGEWWMGMAIANEHAGMSGLAKRAYRQALQVPTSTPVQQYAEKRLQQLTIEQAINDNKQSIE